MSQAHLTSTATASTTASASTPDASQLLKRALETFLAKDMKGFAEFCSEHVVVEFPFSPDDASRKLLGRTALYEYIKGYPDAIDLHRAPTMKILATDDPNLVIAEWSASGRVISNGNPYEMSYATFVTFEDGLIISYREYWNPMAFMAAMNGTMF